MPSLMSPRGCQMKRLRTGQRFGRVWSFETARFTVALELERLTSYQYDGDDEDGETQAKLDSGEFVAFDSSVIVELDGEEIARDSLGGSVYGADQVAAFYTEHRTSSLEYRNTLASKARGVCFCHYFPNRTNTRHTRIHT
jgi:hypothetical protein